MWSWQMETQILIKIKKLSNEIEELNRIRWQFKSNDEIANQLNKKKKQYNMYNNLLKTMRKNKKD